MHLDGTDRAIIAALTHDARASFADVGLAVSLSAPAVKRRVDRLRLAGVIRGFTAVVDPVALGWTTEAFVEVDCVPRSTPAQITDALKRHPEVVEAFTISGDADALVHVRVEHVSHLDDVLDRLRAEPVITATRSMIVLSRLSPATAP